MVSKIQISHTYRR